LNNRVGIASVHGTKEIPDKYIDPGESFNLPKEQLDFVNDIDSMEKIFTGFAAGLSEDQKKYPVGTDRLTLFMEEAAARVLRSRVQDSVITINQEILSEHERKAESVKTNAERILSECGITLSRDLFTTAILEASASDRTEINIEASAANVQLDYVRVETPEYCIVLPRETLEINDPFSIVFMKEPNPAHGNTDEATPGSSILKQGSFQYTVSFSKPIQGMVKLLLPVLPGETEYQAVFASDGTIIPGKYNPANGWFQAGIKTDGTFIVKENRITFSDIDGEPEQMQQAISVLASKGIIKGTSQTEFSPGAGITRAQIAALIVRMLQVLNENEDGGFIDVNKEDWFFGAAGSAKKYGIMQGTGNNAFSPDLFITEDQAIVIAMRVLKEKMWYKRLNNSEDVFNNYFYNLVPSWAKEDVALAFREKLFEIEYGGSELRTYAPMSRGDFAVLLYRLFNRLW